MGLCTSKSAVTLDPKALIMDQASRAAWDKECQQGTPILDEGILMVQPVKTNVEGGASGGIKSTGAVNQTGKGYLELGSKGAKEMDAQTSNDGEEEDEFIEKDDVEELINLSGSDGSLRSEFLE